ncbi:unnamed protein product (macronuclear) [Paramecium tetraurelia]|uniref:Uncharacterized protein n=1 Tax=Paramecium tetraurelia TaxID=5888 RepID=A0D4H3_PARTE|nr:uncharacterized protein GSPATT00013406001 [Paramecium tetraurelia]CAK77940.1 unnamed protein product [Paramecium tetraurelia]|eukprot:XP_001445337.1 hypothetical protein (macronuclear) [Paramecium tetraurelia strain d4-2]
MEQGGQYYNKLLEDNDQYKTNLQYKGQQMEYLIQENNMYKDQMLQLQEENDQITQEITNLQEMLNQNELYHQDPINIQNSDQKKDKKHSRRQIKELEKLVIKREQELSHLYGKMEDMKNYITQIKHQSDKYEQNLQQLYKDYQQLEAERNKYVHKIDQMQNYNERYSTLQQQLQNQEKHKNKEYHSLKNQCDQLQMHNLQYQQQIQTINDEYGKLSQQCIDLQELNEQYMQESQILKDSLIEKDQKLERMQLQLQQLQQKDLQIQQQVRDHNQQLKEFQNNKQEFQSQIIQLQRDNQQFCNQINTLKEQQTKELKDHLNIQEQYKKEKQTLVDRIKMQDERFSEMEIKYKNIEIYLKQVEEERLYRAQAEQYYLIYILDLSKKSLNNVYLLRQVANLENELQRNEEELKQLKKNNKNSQNFDKTTQQLILKDREILHLQSVVERLEGMNRQLQQECDRLAAKIQLTSHENSLLSKTNREINQMGRLILEGQQIKEMLEKKKYEKPLTITNNKAPQVIQQLQQHSRRPSVKKP